MRGQPCYIDAHGERARAAGQLRSGSAHRSRGWPSGGRRCWRRIANERQRKKGHPLTSAGRRKLDLRFAAGNEIRQARGDLLHEASQRAVALLAGSPVLARKQQQRAKAARSVVEAAQLLVNGLRIANVVDAELDQIVEVQVVDWFAQ